MVEPREPYDYGHPEGDEDMEEEEEVQPRYSNEGPPQAIGEKRDLPAVPEGEVLHQQNMKV